MDVGYLLLFDIECRTFEAYFGSMLIDVGFGMYRFGWRALDATHMMLNFRYRYKKLRLDCRRYRG